MARTVTKAPKPAEASTETAVEAKHETPIELVGTWEEIQERADLFAGKKVRVSVIPERGRRIRLEELTPLPDDLSLAGAFNGKLGEFSFEPSDLSERTGERFTELMAEKYRKGHL